jgi:DNA-binding beta-propeller fold protein YncE
MANDVSRRQFIQQTGTAAAALTLGRLPGFGATGGNMAPIILGSGSHKYECIHDWLTPPDNIKFGDTHGVVQDAKGHIYVAHTVHPTSASDDAIVVYDQHGKFIKSWGARFKGGAHGIDIRKEGHQEFIYHCDVAHNVVVKTTLDGDVIWEKGVPQEPGVYKAGAPFTPTNVAFSPDGGFYISDGYGSSWIHQYDKNANWVRTFGGKGSEAGKVNCPHGIWLDDRGHEPMLAVADRSNRRIQYFSLDGKHISFVTEGMRQPCHFHLRHGEMLVPDLDSLITILDKDNKVVAALGDGDSDGHQKDLRGAPRDQFIPGKFIHPHDAVFLHNGDILVSEWVPIGRVTLLKRV